MNKAQLKKFRGLLEEKREEIVRKAKQTLDEDMTLDADDLPDEMDLASSEYLQSFTFRLRGREKSFLDKIEKALARIDDGSFGLCEECGEEIAVKRLEEEGDSLYHEWLGKAFEGNPDPMLVIKWKELYDNLEKSLDMAEDAANVVESIAIKHG